MNVAILGYGVVGSGVAEVISKNTTNIDRKAGEEIRLKKILDIRDFPDSPHRNLLTSNAGDIFEDASIGIVVETMGGIGKAYEFTKRALSSRKHVVTSNKELVATHGPELLKLARENGVNYMFEASVGGGIPVIRPLSRCLAANEITGITGILNGTTNYILTQMKRDGAGFDAALKSAQRNGYAEADPAADIEGHDACRKLAILSSIAYNHFVDYRNIHTEGITEITPEDMEYAAAMDSVIKLIAVSRHIGDEIFARVAPAIISKAHPLANVEDVFNAILIEGDATGDVMFYGRGAGKLPTASAVVADIIDISMHKNSIAGTLWESREAACVADIEESEARFFARVKTGGKEKARAGIKSKFGEVRFIVLDRPGFEDELAFITSTLKERDFRKGIWQLREEGLTDRTVSFIRMEE